MLEEKNEVMDRMEVSEPLKEERVVGRDDIQSGILLSLSLSSSPFSLFHFTPHNFLQSLLIFC